MHFDWLGSSRLASTPAHSVSYTGAYAPFGESYVETSSYTYRSFTGQHEDTVQGLADFMYREYSDQQQGRWISPDPAGLAAVDITSPQSWNRYAYVLNNPLALIDPFGLKDCDNSDSKPCRRQDPGNFNDAMGSGCWVTMGDGSLMACQALGVLISGDSITCTGCPPGSTVDASGFIYGQKQVPLPGCDHELPSVQQYGCPTTTQWSVIGFAPVTFNFGSQTTGLPVRQITAPSSPQAPSSVNPFSVRNPLQGGVKNYVAYLGCGANMLANYVDKKGDQLYATILAIPFARFVGGFVGGGATALVGVSSVDASLNILQARAQCSAFAYDRASAPF